MGPPPTEFRILGPLEVRVGGRTVEIKSVKQRALLAILLLRANEVVSADRLVNELWGEAPPADPLHSLQALIHQLRRVLKAQGDERLIATQQPGYVVHVRPGALDLHVFQRSIEDATLASSRGDWPRASTTLRQALSLWRGSALLDLAFEQFAQPAIARLEELRRAAIEARIDADLALGRHGELVGELEELVALNPLAERFQAQLMIALYRSGRQTEALHVYTVARDALVSELGLEPSPALQRLELAILRHHSELELPPTMQTAGVAPLEHSLARSILVVASEPDSIDGLLDVAEPLARTALASELILARLVADTAELKRAGKRLQESRVALSSRNIAARVVCFTSPDAGTDLVRFASDQDVDLLLLDCEDDSPGKLPDLLVAVLRGCPCDVVFVCRRPQPLGDGSIAVPFSGSENDWCALELGAWIASASGRALTLVGSKSRDRKRDSSRLLAHASLVTQRFLDVISEPMLVDPGIDALLEAVGDPALLITGISERWESEGIGNIRLALTRELSRPVLFARRGVRPSVVAPPEGMTRFAWSEAP